MQARPARERELRPFKILPKGVLVQHRVVFFATSQDILETGFGKYLHDGLLVLIYSGAGVKDSLTLCRVDNANKPGEVLQFDLAPCSEIVTYLRSAAPSADRPGKLFCSMKTAIIKKVQRALQGQRLARMSEPEKELHSDFAVVVLLHLRGCKADSKRYYESKALEH